MGQTISEKDINKDIKKFIQQQTKAFKTALFISASEKVRCDISDYYKKTIPAHVLMKRLKRLMAVQDSSKNTWIPAILAIVTGIMITALALLFEGATANINSAIELIKGRGFLIIVATLAIVILIWFAVYFLLVLLISCSLNRVYQLHKATYDENVIIFYPYEINLIKEKLIKDYGFDIESKHSPNTITQCSDQNVYLTVENGSQRLKYKLVEVEQYTHYNDLKFQ